VIFDLRHDLYRTLQRLPLRWYDQRATGDIMTRVTDDVTAMERVLIDGVEQGIIAVLQIVGVGVMLFWINARLAAWMLLPVPFLIAGAVWYTMTARFRYREQRRAASAMNSLLLDNLQGVRQIKSYAREEPELGRFSKAARLVGETQLVVMRAFAIYSSGMTFIAALARPSFFTWAAATCSGPRPNSPWAISWAFFSTRAMFYDPVRQLHQINQLYQAGRASSERVAENSRPRHRGLWRGEREASGAGGGRSNIGTFRSPIVPMCRH